MSKVISFMTGLFICLWIGIAAIAGYNYKHPYLCSYKYIKGHYSGIAQDCGGGADYKYCLKGAIHPFRVDKWVEICGRR